MRGDLSLIKVPILNCRRIYAYNTLDHNKIQIIGNHLTKRCEINKPVTTNEIMEQNNVHSKLKLYSTQALQPNMFIERETAVIFYINPLKW